MKAIISVAVLLSTTLVANAETIVVSTQQVVHEVNTESAVVSGAAPALQTRRPGNLPTAMTFEVVTPKAGTYRLGIDYAIHVPRPLTVTINGRVVRGNAAAAPTGGYTNAFRQVSQEGDVFLAEGKNAVVLSRGGDIPHVFGIVLARAE